jgi:hypothetical protein
VSRQIYNARELGDTLKTPFALNFDEPSMSHDRSVFHFTCEGSREARSSCGKRGTCFLPLHTARLYLLWVAPCRDAERYPRTGGATCGNGLLYTHRNTADFQGRIAVDQPSVSHLEHNRREVRAVPAPHVMELPERKKQRLPRPPLARKYITSVLKRWVQIRHRLRLARDHNQERFTTCRYFGADHLIRIDDVIGWEMAIHRFEWRQIHRIIEACQRLAPAIFIDVGANAGLYSCILGRRKLVPSIIAFEPDRRNLIHLRANLMLNGLLDDVEVREVALGAASRSATLVPELSRPVRATAIRSLLRRWTAFCRSRGG